MSKTIVICGYGPGISKAVAEKFGAKGFAVALVARSADKLAAGVKALEAKGIKAAAVQANVGDPSAARDAIKKARAALGPVTVLQWTAYDGGAGDLTNADSAAIRGVLDVGITGLLAAVQEALPDLRKQENAAILVTNGGLGYFDPQVDDAAVAWNAMGLAVANSAKHKLVGTAVEEAGGRQDLRRRGHGAEHRQGDGVRQRRQATIDAATVADKFWELYRGARGGHRTGQVEASLPFELGARQARTRRGGGSPHSRSSRRSPAGLACRRTRSLGPLLEPRARCRGLRTRFRRSAVDLAELFSRALGS